MGQVLVPEKISNLTVTGALTLSLPASIVNIGGQQYRTTTAKTLDMSVTGEGGLDIGTIAADTDYYVYGILNGSGGLDVVASLATEDVGPTGFISWRLIGAFFTDGSSQVDGVYANSPGLGKPVITPEATVAVPGLNTLPAKCKVYQTSSQVPGANNHISMQTVDINDSDGRFSINGAGVVTCNFDGYVQVIGRVSYISEVTQPLVIRKNNVNQDDSAHDSGDGLRSMEVTSFFQVSDGDFITMTSNNGTQTNPGLNVTNMSVIQIL